MVRRILETNVKSFLAAVIVAVISSTAMAEPPAVGAPLTVHLDAEGPYLILASTRAGADYAKAIAAAKQLHPAAPVATFPPDDLASARKILHAQQPRYVLLFLKPE